MESSNVPSDDTLTTTEIIRLIGAVLVAVGAISLVVLSQKLEYTTTMHDDDGDDLSQTNATDEWNINWIWCCSIGVMMMSTLVQFVVWKFPVIPNVLLGILLGVTASFTVVPAWQKQQPSSGFLQSLLFRFVPSWKKATFMGCFHGTLLLGGSMIAYSQFTRSGKNWVANHSSTYYRGLVRIVGYSTQFWDIEDDAEGEYRMQGNVYIEYHSSWACPQNAIGRCEIPIGLGGEECLIYDFDKSGYQNASFSLEGWDCVNGFEGFPSQEIDDDRLQFQYVYGFETKDDDSLPDFDSRVKPTGDDWPYEIRMFVSCKACTNAMFIDDPKIFPERYLVENLRRNMYFNGILGALLLSIGTCLRLKQRHSSRAGATSTGSFELLPTIVEEGQHQTSC